LKKVEAKLEEGWQEAEEYREMTDLRQNMAVRERNNERQRKHRQLLYDAEIARGERTPGGAKLNLKVST
jgi:hypothetical protein